MVLHTLRIRVVKILSLLLNCLPELERLREGTLIEVLYSLLVEVIQLGSQLLEPNPLSIPILYFFEARVIWRKLLQFGQSSQTFVEFLFAQQTFGTPV